MKVVPMRGCRYVSCGILLGVIVWIAGLETTAQARPTYMAAFKSAYPALAGQVDTAKCNVCHFGQPKSNRNDYGLALTKALGNGEDIKDQAVIKDALKKAEAAKNDAGKTFGELIKSGQLPGKAP